MSQLSVADAKVSPFLKLVQDVEHVSRDNSCTCEEKAKRIAHLVQASFFKSLTEKDIFIGYMSHIIGSYVTNLVFKKLDAGQA